MAKGPLAGKDAARSFPNHLARILIFPDSEEHRLPKAIIARPLSELGAFIGSTKSGRGAEDNFIGRLETSTPRRLNLVGAIFRLIVFFGAGTSVFAGEWLNALVMAAKGSTRLLNINSVQFNQMHPRTGEARLLQSRCPFRNWLSLDRKIQCDHSTVLGSFDGHELDLQVRLRVDLQNCDI